MQRNAKTAKTLKKIKKQKIITRLIHFLLLLLFLKKGIFNPTQHVIFGKMFLSVGDSPASLGCFVYLLLLQMMSDEPHQQHDEGDTQQGSNHCAYYRRIIHLWTTRFNELINTNSTVIWSSEREHKQNGGGTV